MTAARLLLLGPLLAVALTATGCAAAQARPKGAPHAAAEQGLDAELFYQLLLAELTRRDDPGAAYSLTLEAARRSGHPHLFRRAVDIALSGRAPNAALDAARAWVRAQSDDEDARRVLVQLLAGLQRTEELGTALRDWLQVASPSRRLEIIDAIPALLARSAEPAQAVAAARTALQAWLQRPPTAAAAWAALGAVQWRAGLKEDALQSATRAVQADAAYPAGALLAAELIETDPAAARALLYRYQQATRDQPAASADVPIAWAQALARRGELDAALALLQSSRVRDSAEQRRLWMAQARLLREAERDQDAYDTLAQALRAHPDDPDLSYELAMSAERLGRHDEMERLLRELIARRPDDPHAYNALGYSLADRGVRLEEARQLIQEALRRAPDDGYIIDSLGWVEYRLGNVAEARRWLARAMELKPDAEIAAHLGEVLWVLGERDEARRIWRQGLELDARNRTLRETLRRFGVEP
ncbi:Beta-barrel assembly-enhancing protease [Tepidimonas alkaliphilus]|uniref:Beta-barrel assembly-enhancing protease n=1 Tax=Tepidimonas alkaliphilus TaxID=2588942 RepID=A0A554W5W9_9BURK|nr:tetratricopeptide repeat protein [Tepidimonas alkaliphilus]TSE18975.1 Beta-barrel assembly-enhancing protease [Tepidimonas alkaliphilus]